MKVLVDTSVWSLALHRDVPKQNYLVDELRELIQEVRVQMVGPIRQELLSGIKSEKQFNSLKEYLSAFPDLPIRSADYELAAHYFNINRKNGVQGSNTDFLICAIAVARNMEILTNDKDFERYQKFIPIKLYIPRNK